MLYYFINWTASNTADVLGAAGGMISDLMPLIVIIGGIMLVGLVFSVFRK